MTATCGGSSGSYAFNIDAVSDGVLALSGGAWNCNLESGRIDGTRITLSCSNWLNKVDYQGTLVSDNFMQGTFTQRLRAETCQWSTLKAGTAAPEVRNAAQAVGLPRQWAMFRLGMFSLARSPKAILPRAGVCPSST